MTDGTQHYRSLVTALEEDFHAIGNRLLPLFGNINHTKKLSTYDVLTELDIEVEERLIQRLNELDPGTPVVGEEHGGDRAANRYWLVDPIDGTIHFTRGNPLCAIMLALIEDNRPVVSIIYNIATKDIYFAVKGGGAYKNNVRLSTSARGPKEAMVMTEMRLHTDRNLAIYQKLANQYKLMNMACAGYEFLMVADGRAEARLCLDPFGKDYDFAPGALLVQEAGGVVKDFKGEAYQTSHKDFIIAASEAIYSDLLSVVA